MSPAFRPRYFYYYQIPEEKRVLARGPNGCDRGRGNCRNVSKEQAGVETPGAGHDRPGQQRKASVEEARGRQPTHCGFQSHREEKIPPLSVTHPLPCRETQGLPTPQASQPRAREVKQNREAGRRAPCLGNCAHAQLSTSLADRSFQMSFCNDH